MLVKKPIGGKLWTADFHWYVEDEGQWKNKNGTLEATDKVLEGFVNNKPDYGEKITDYKAAGALLKYEVVGEFYITRKDGKKFE